jgi:deferrochelatase/peroxidase EfeB
VLLGAGSSLFDGRYGLASRKPAKLKPMTMFPDDALDPAWCHGDLSLTLSAEEPDTVLHALRDLTRATRGGMQLRWKIDGSPHPRVRRAHRATCWASRTARPTRSRPPWTVWCGRTRAAATR